MSEIDLKKACTETEFAELNAQLEAQVEDLEADIEKLKVYEKGYHIMEKKLQSAVDRVDDLIAEKNNLDTVHTELLIDYRLLKSEAEKTKEANARLKASNTEMKTSIDYLKEQLYHTFSKNEEEDPE